MKEEFVCPVSQVNNVIFEETRLNSNSNPNVSKKKHVANSTKLILFVQTNPKQIRPNK